MIIFFKMCLNYLCLVFFAHLAQYKRISKSDMPRNNMLKIKVDIIVWVYCN